MIGGFSPIPSKFKDLFKRDTYGDKWYHPICGFVLILVMLSVWNFIIVPYRKLFKSFNE